MEGHQTNNPVDPHGPGDELDPHGPGDVLDPHGGGDPLDAHGLGSAVDGGDHESEGILIPAGVVPIAFDPPPGDALISTESGEIFLAEFV